MNVIKKAKPNNIKNSVQNVKKDYFFVDFTHHKMNILYRIQKSISLE